MKLTAIIIFLMFMAGCSHQRALVDDCNKVEGSNMQNCAIQYYLK